jgi:membrane carboxypeptidase/penicillin-binding protein PbpC
VTRSRLRIPDQDQAASPVSPAPTRVPPRRWPRRTVNGAVAVVLVGAAALGLLLALTPGVGDAPARVRAWDAAHHVTDTTGPPPAKVSAALIAVEDGRFYSHPGIDPVAVAKVLLTPVRGSGDPGGATLDQQLVKILYTGGRDDPKDQIAQAGLALKLDATYSKTRILRMYLNTVYFGHGYYGVTAAAHGYFGTGPARLDWPQAALLAGLVKAPTGYDPYRHPALARARRAHVLDRLRVQGTLTAAQVRTYTRAGLELD